jgi:hypothetical protein
MPVDAAPRDPGPCHDRRRRTGSDDPGADTGADARADDDLDG